MRVPLPRQSRIHDVAEMIREDRQNGNAQGKILESEQKAAHLMASIKKLGCNFVFLYRLWKQYGKAYDEVKRKCDELDTANQLLVLEIELLKGEKEKKGE